MLTKNGQKNKPLASHANGLPRNKIRLSAVSVSSYIYYIKDTAESQYFAGIPPRFGLVMYSIFSTKQHLERKSKMTDTYSPCPGGGSHSQSQVGSLETTRLQVCAQIGADDFRLASDRLRANDLALIIAEVLLLRPETDVQIGGDKLPASMVQEVFRKLTHDHVLATIIHFEKATYEIKHVKTYLRTALYNAVFETEARATNEAAADLPVTIENWRR